MTSTSSPRDSERIGPSPCGEGRKGNDMIIAHLFLRKNRNRMYVMCETTSSRGVKPPYPTPEQMFEVELSDDQSEWEDRIRKRITAERPDLEFGETLRSRKPVRGRPGSFDMVFHVRKSRGLLERIGLR